MIFKHTLSSYLSSAAKTTTLNIHILQFLLTSMTELQLLSPPQNVYNHAFASIRMLAMNLRNALTTQTEDSVKKVFSWTFIWSCRLWASVVSSPQTNSKNSKNNLSQLTYPLVQVILGAIRFNFLMYRLKSSSKYFPFRFHCVRLIIEIQSKTSLFIPAASYLFDIFESVEVQKRGSASTNKRFEFQTNIKAPKGYLGTKVFQVDINNFRLVLLKKPLLFYIHIFH